MQDISLESAFLNYDDEISCLEQTSPFAHNKPHPLKIRCQSEELNGSVSQPQQPLFMCASWQNSNRPTDTKFSRPSEDIGTLLNDSTFVQKRTSEERRKQKNRESARRSRQKRKCQDACLNQLVCQMDVERSQCLKEKEELQLALQHLQAVMIKTIDENERLKNKIHWLESKIALINFD